MNLWDQMVLGFSVSLVPANLIYCFIGVFLGTLIGVLPGIGPMATLSLLMATTFHISPVAAIIMLAGIYYGAMYGGSTTSILVNMPGEAASIITCVDGYQMARKGRAGPALGISAFGSFIAGTLSIIGLMLLAPVLVRYAVRFGPPEYFSLMVFGLCIVSSLAKGSLSKALIMVCFGLFLGAVGQDSVSGKLRFTLGTLYLQDGVNIVPVCMGLFGISEVLLNVEETVKQEVFKANVKGILPNLRDWKDSLGPILRGTGIGFLLGILPGGGAVLSSFFAYAIEKKISKHPERFGQGVIEGVAAPESANNAATGGAFIPLLSLGIPANAVMALLLGAMIIHGVAPGPLLIQRNPEMFWGVITSMYIGNAMLLILNLPLIGVWIKLLSIPYRFLFPFIILFCVIGVFNVHDSPDDVVAMTVFGILGYLFRKLSFDMVPLILALVLGPLFEFSFCQSLNIGHGNIFIFLERPISAALLFISAGSLALTFLPLIRKRRAEIAKASTEP